MEKDPLIGLDTKIKDIVYRSSNRLVIPTFGRNTVSMLLKNYVVGTIGYLMGNMIYNIFRMFPLSNALYFSFTLFGPGILIGGFLTYLDLPSQEYKEIVEQYKNTQTNS